MHHADFFFSGIGPSAPTGDCSVTLGGISLSGFRICIGDDEAAYYTAFDNIITGVPRSCAASFTLALAEVHDYDYVYPNSSSNITAGCVTVAPETGRFSLKMVSGEFYKHALCKQGSIPPPVSKVTAQHHTHYNWSEILSVIQKARVAEMILMRKLLKMRNVTDAAISGYALWLNTLDDHLLLLIASLNCWDESTLEIFAGALKTAVRKAKLLQNNSSANLLPIFEAEVLVNRGIGAVDWAAEKDHRLKPDTVAIKADYIYSEARKIIEKGKNEHGPYKSMSWKEYWQARWQYTPTGSIKSQHGVDLEDLPTDFRLRNKFVALNTTHVTDFDDWITREPSIHAWASTKYEWGKERAIYGCDLTNFVLTNYAMYECEERLPPNFPVGRRAEPTYVSRLLAGVLKGHEAFCFDFEDFNAQHSTEAMVAVLRAYADTYWHAMTEEQQQAFNWVIMSAANQVVHDNIGGGGTYKSRGTLFSGWRLTTFMNSVLNAIYSQVIYEPTEASRPMTSAHNGDDIIIGVDNALQAQGMLRNALKYNVRAQPSKCVLAGAAEFLRVDRNHAECGQYLARGVATLVHSRIESGPTISLRDALRANETRLSEFVDRGGDLDTAMRLRDIYLRRVASLYDNTPEEASLVLELSSVTGGLSMSRQARVDYVAQADTVADGDGAAEVLHLRGKRAWRGVADFTDVILEIISTKSRSTLNRKDVAKRIYNSTLSALSLTRRRVKLTYNRFQDRARNWREHKGTFAHLKKSGTFGLARLAGIRLDVMTDMGDEVEALISKMSQSCDPFGFMTAIL